MESAAAPESGAPWAGRGGVGAGGGGGNAAGPAAGAGAGADGSAAQDPYREQAYDPLISARQSNPRSSRWSDAPPGQGSAQDASVAPAGLEPPFKKVRNDSQGVHGQGSADYVDGSAAAYGTASGYGEAPPGMAYGRSGTPTAGGGVAAQNYGGAGGQTYGVRYGGGTYGQNAPAGSQSYGSHSAPVSFAPGSAKATGALFYKTKLCTKFKLGACTFNERCNFAHGMEELRKPPSGWEDMVSAAGSGNPLMGGGVQPRKTKLCRYFLDGNCPYGDRCNFLHGNDEAQNTPGMEAQGVAGRVGSRGPSSVKPNYKTRLCAKWEKGEFCDFGDKCHFAHGPAELQSYTGVSTYPNGGPVTADMQYSSVPPEMAAPVMYGDPSMMNPASIPAPYGVPMNYAGSNPVATPNINPYQALTNLNPYAISHDGSNGASANYNYWGGEKKWEGASVAPGQTPVPTQAYVQGNQTAPWTTDYSAGGGYVQRENETASTQYPQEQVAQQQQSAQFYNGGTVYNYQDPKQSSNTPYVQDDNQSKYPAEARNGDGGYYGNVYSEATYAAQQPDYSARYNMAEPWGGKM